MLVHLRPSRRASAACLPIAKLGKKAEKSSLTKKNTDAVMVNQEAGKQLVVYFVIFFWQGFL